MLVLMTSGWRGTAALGVQPTGLAASFADVVLLDEVGVIPAFDLVPGTVLDHSIASRGTAQKERESYTNDGDIVVVMSDSLPRRHIRNPKSKIYPLSPLLIYRDFTR